MTSQHKHHIAHKIDEVEENGGNQNHHRKKITLVNIIPR